MNRLIFQLVLQFTELTWGSTEAHDSRPDPRPSSGQRTQRGCREEQASLHYSTRTGWLLQPESPELSLWG